MQLVRDRAARDQSRLDSGTGSPKDLQALQHELDLARPAPGRARGRRARGHGAGRGRRVGGEPARPPQRETLGAQLSELEAARDAALRDLDTEAQRVGAPRADTVAGVGEDLVALYEKIRTQSGGLAAAPAAPAPLRGVPARAQQRRHVTHQGGAGGRGAALRGVPQDPGPHRRVGHLTQWVEQLAGWSSRPTAARGATPASPAGARSCATPAPATCCGRAPHPWGRRPTTSRSTPA